jgi:hypothetical protein
MDATKRTLAIPELLEIILSHLPIRDLLLGQRVCRLWQQCITASSLLQQRLFFKSKPMPENVTETGGDGGPKHHTLWETNPLLATILPTVKLPHEEFHKDFEFSSWMRPEEENDMRFRKAIMRPDASWRRMYPIQPPARIHEIRLWGLCCGDSDDEWVSIRKEYEYMQQHGSTMGFIYDVSVMIFDSRCNDDGFIRWEIWLEEGLGLNMYLTYYRECSGYEGKATGLKIVELDCETVTGLD